jgi:hypothetical protein
VAYNGDEEPLFFSLVVGTSSPKMLGVELSSDTGVGRTFCVIDPLFGGGGKYMLGCEAFAILLAKLPWGVDVSVRAKHRGRYMYVIMIIRRVN